MSVTLTGVTPAQAVLRVLEGQGLNYALRMDPRAVRVETLLMVAGSGAGTVAPPPPPRPQLGPRQIDREPDVAEPDDETPAEAMALEVAGLPESSRLASSSDLSVYLARSGEIPSVLTEIGRLHAEAVLAAAAELTRLTAS